MTKITYLFILLFTASIIFSSCSCDNDDNATTDPGVLIGYIDGNPIRWATRNVAAPGRFAQNATDAGMFFQWNRRTAWSASDPMVSSPAGTTWDSTHATDGTWARTNDPCPRGWRVPTRAEFDALLNAGYQWTTQSGVNGTVFGSGNNTLFLPAAGSRNPEDGALFNTLGHYWSSSPNTYNAWAAMYLFLQRSSSTVDGAYRALGFSVRCVAE